MNLNKYVEIHCKEIFLQREKLTSIQVEGHFPTLTTPSNVCRTSLQNFQKSAHTTYPITNTIIFNNYVREFLQVHFAFEFSHKKSSNVLTFARNTTIPLFTPQQLPIYVDKQKTGYALLDIYIRPVLTTRSFFHNPVVLFPISENEIIIYYSGFLYNTRQLYCMSTTNDWTTHTLQKMYRHKNIWSTIIHKNNHMKQIELAFTNEKDIWDNQNGNNWLFTESVWY